MLVFLVFVVLMIAGCSSPTSSGSKETASKNDKPSEKTDSDESELNLYIPNYYNQLEKQQWENLVKKFEELNPGVKVTLTNGDVNTESGKLTTLLQSGVTPPDVILMYPGPGRVRILSDVGLIKPLEDLYTQNNWKEKLQPFAYELANLNDKIYELPYTFDAIQAYYNKDIFNKYGIDVPKTGEEFVAAMKTLKDNGVTPLNTAVRTPVWLGTLFSNVMQAVSSQDEVEALLYNEKKWSDPEFVEAAEILADWAKKEYIGKESMSLNNTDLKFAFLNNQFGMMVTTTSSISDIVEKDLVDQFGLFPIPSFQAGGKTNPTGGLGYSWVVPTAAANSKNAEKWLDYTLSEDYSNILYGDKSYNLILTSTASLDGEVVNPLLADTVTRLKSGSGFNPSVFIGSEEKEAYYQNLTGLLGGLVSPEECDESDGNWQRKRYRSRF